MTGLGGLVLAAASVAQTGTAALAATTSAAATQSVPASSLASTSGIYSFIATTVPHAVASVLSSNVTTSTPVTAQVVTVPLELELLAVLIGALGGGIIAVERKFDITGVFTLAIVTGLGGGIIRDLIVQKFGVAAFASNYYLAAAIAGGVLAFFFASGAKRVRRGLFLIDAVSLGLFAAVGADKALFAGFKLIPAILLGTITSIGGGMIRDVLIDEQPAVLRPGQPLYGFAAVLGATLYVLLVYWLDFTKNFATLTTVSFVVLLRIIAVWRGWEAPRPVDYSDQVVALPRKVLGWTPVYTGRTVGDAREGVPGEAEAGGAEAGGEEPEDAPDAD